MHRYRYIVILILLLTSNFVFSLPFTPMVRNFSVSDYKAGLQNWSICQDSNGCIYVGNNKGLLVYDGLQWDCYALPNNEVVRVVKAIDKRIYVGSYEEFGYFERDICNVLVYTSLSKLVENYNYNQDEIWTIVSYGDEVLFQSFASYFVYNGVEVTAHQGALRPLYFFQLDSTIYVQEMNGEFYEYVHGNYIQVFKNSLKDHVVSVIKHPEGGLLLVTENSGVYHYVDNFLKVISVDKEIASNRMNRAILTKDSLLVLGTLANGLYAMNLDGTIKWHLNSTSILQNNTVLGLYNDESNNIWVALDNGISYVENNSLISVFVPDTKNFGVVYGYHAQDNINYFATNQGVYCYDESKKIFYSEESVNEQSWFVRSYYNQILCGNNKGLNLLKERKQISDIAGAMSSVRYHSENGEVLIVGTYSDLVIIIQDEHGSLNERNYINDVNLVSKHIEVDYKGRLWVQDMHKGIYRITLSSDLLNVDKKEKVALPSEVTGSVYLLKHDGLIVLSTSDGFFIPDHNDELIKHNSFNVLELGNIYPHQLTMVDRTLFWLSYDSFFRLISIDDDGVYNEVTRVSASLNGTATIENIATVVHNPNDNYSYFQLNGMLARTNPWTLTVKSLIRPLVVNQIWCVEEKADSKRAFKKYLPIKSSLELPFKQNSIGFRFSHSNYESDKNFQIRAHLDGYDFQWRMVDAGELEYHNLPSGKYQLHIELLNQDNVLSDIVCDIRILDPWYRSGIAIACYILLVLICILAILYVIFRIMNKRRISEIKQQEEEYERAIAQQNNRIYLLEKTKLEEELTLKSKELSEVTLNNIAHQEFLEMLKSEIKEHKKTGTEHKKFLDILYHMIQSNLLSEEDNWQRFQTNFDTVHENFLKNLKERYPSLTSGDLRMCALLRLNFSTKDIAYMLNITTRGVDTARYRLRKKLNMSSDESFLDFLLQFK